MSANSTRAVLDLVRPDLRGFGGYKSARTEDLKGDLWLNANESAWSNPADPGALVRRYPDPQPAALRAALAGLYGCAESDLLIGRGSDEAIDLLVRTLCVAGQDAVVATPPVFGMYAVSARLQGARLIAVPLIEGAAGFAPDFDGIATAVLEQGAKLVFLCSPANPTGRAIAPGDIQALLLRLQGRALVVVDEAYGEFSGVESALTLRARFPELVVLRTLSKAHALAAARIGVAIADPRLIAVLRACQAPYPVPAPCAAVAVAGLSADVVAITRQRAASLMAERERLSDALSRLPGVRRVYASDANFLLVRFVDAERAFGALLAAGIVVRDQRGAPQLGDALRITVGTPEQNARVLAALGAQAVAA